MSYLLVALLASGALASDSVRVVKDIDYVEGADYAEGKDRLDLYLPDGARDFPVLVFYHGGGLRNGDKGGSEHVGMALASAGYGAAIVNYRLSPTVEHPEHAEDAARSLAWVYRNIAKHGGNPDAVYISGHSAGAYLAALLALDARYLVPVQKHHNLWCARDLSKMWVLYVFGRGFVGLRANENLGRNERRIVSNPWL